MIRLVMYDLDGTLLDTASEIAGAVNLALADFGAQPVDEAVVRSWIGHGTVRLMQQAWQKIDAETEWDEVMAAFTKHYRQTVGTTSRPYPYVMETLGRLKDMGIKQAVVTNKETQFTRRVLEKHGLGDFFDLVVSGDTLPVRKPDPAVIHHCLRTLDETVENSLFVGDSDIDVATANSAGVQCWVVPYGYNAGRDVRLAGADRLIDDVRAVIDFMETSPCPALTARCN
ncbi:phosphoglycolate phosphatase [Methylophilaceae bacterium]|nr:phosphoglycolate phosphatase [Methylophilaceae bacterium]